MGKQIIQQPGTDKFAIFSSVTDTIIFWDGTENEVIEHFVAEAAEREREEVTRLIEEVKLGQPRRPYAQFKLSWEEAVAMDREHDGEAWCDLVPTDTEGN
jgi:hypothetical protein